MDFVPRQPCEEGSNCHTAKKARPLPSWEASLVMIDSKRGLAELFGGRSTSHSLSIRTENPSGNREERVHIPPRSQSNGGLRRRFLGSPTSDEDDGFFTLRMEHRQGGAGARHQGEERILLFRSDRAGAIAKIVFSSTPAPVCGENDFDKMSQAKIHVLDVKEQYRGRDLGGLLFSEAASALRLKYNSSEDCESSSHCSILSSSVRCQLDAEEDVRRHNKLVGFYEQLGCRVKPKARVQYLNNNDGETYRKIPMEIALIAQNCSSGRRREKLAFTEGSLIGRGGGFLPVKLLEVDGKRVGIPSGRRRSCLTSRRVDWLMVDDEKGNIQFRTTEGHVLLADLDGRCSAVMNCDNGEEANDKIPAKLSNVKEWANFSLFRVSDKDEKSPREPEVRRKELWMLQSSHGNFLRTDPVTHTLLCSQAPAFWQANGDDLSLTCTSDTPPRRQHYRKTWVKQTVKYVTTMRDKYLGFSIKRMSIREALDVIKNVPFEPFRVGGSGTRPCPSLRTLCFRAAEAAREAGYPDWFQYVALVHELGSVLSHIGLGTVSLIEGDYDWTVACRSRVVGCAAPSRASFREFRHLNADESDSRYNSDQGMYDLNCGLENVLLTWTGPEYMYHMLKRNSVLIPDEGFAMLRLFPLGDWHTFGEYELLTNDEDDEFRPFVNEFDKLRRLARRECRQAMEITDEACNKLWNETYAEIVFKYSGGDLQW